MSQKQSSGLDMLRTLASLLRSLQTRENSFWFEEDDNGQLHSAELCQCIPEPLVDKTLTLTLVRKNYIISAHLSSGKFDKCDCEGIHLPNGTSLECGEGMKEHRSLKDINSNKWDEEVENSLCVIVCQVGVEFVL